MKMREKALITGITVVYAAFLAVDLAFPKQWLLSSSIKYAGMWICFAFVLSSRGRALSPHDWKWAVIAFACTLGADVFLLFEGSGLAGLGIFCGAHLAWQVRYRLRAHRPLLIITAAFWVIIVALQLAGVGGPLENLAAGMYAVLLIADAVGAFRADLPLCNARLARVGMVLFILCDLNVALHNVLMGGGFYNLATILMWVFYMPAQLCLALSVVQHSERPAGSKNGG